MTPAELRAQIDAAQDEATLLALARQACALWERAEDGLREICDEGCTSYPGDGCDYKCFEIAARTLEPPR